MNLKTSSFEDLSLGSHTESALRIPSITERGPPGSGQPYFDWRTLFPELQILLDHFDSILEEAKTIQKVHHSALFYNLCHVSGFLGLRITLPRMVSRIGPFSLSCTLSPRMTNPDRCGSLPHVSTVQRRLLAFDKFPIFGLPYSVA